MAAEAPPLVSVVIPCYNHGQFLADAVQSVLRQTHPACEAIVVDDGSTDSTPQVAAAFGGAIRSIRQVNQGLSAARNRGIEAATGETVVFLDADDLLEPAYVATLLALADRTPAVEGAYGGYRLVDEANRPLPQVENRVVAPAALHAQLLQGNFWVPESLMVRRRALLAVGLFDRAHGACADWEMWLRLTGRYAFAGTGEVLVRYRVVTNSMSSNPARMQEDRLAVLGKHLGPEPAPGGASPAHLAYANAWLRAGVEYLGCGDDAAAYDHLRRAAVLAPSMLTEVATHYELVCARQPKGYRGEAEGLHLETNGPATVQLVAQLAADPALATAVGGRRNAIFGAAYSALGQLAYKVGDAAAARHYLALALRHDPGRAPLGLLARSAIGPENVRRLKTWLPGGESN